MAKEIRVVFDGPPDHEAGRFVEVEDADGRGLSVGEWKQIDSGLWGLYFHIDDGLDKRVRACADKHLDRASESERKGNASGAAELRRVANLLYALLDGNAGEVVI